MQTLYRKYRAANFDQLIGQDHIVKIIKQSIIENRISHAYLFTGPRGTGKTSLARLLAKVLNCKDISPAGEPCNKCSSCNAINKGNFMDLIEIDAASNRGIEEIRDLKEKINFLPVEGKKKVYIIDEVHMMTTEAFNALLKTLEEPPQNVIFILATTEPHKLPLTIISRTQRFDFKQADNKSLNQKLKYIIDSEGFSIDEGALELIIRAGQGSFRDAETVLEKVLSSVDNGKNSKTITRSNIENILSFVSIEVVRNFIEALIANDLNRSLEVLHKVWEDGMNLFQFTKEVLDEVRVQLLKKVINPGANNQNKKLIMIIKEMNQASNEMKNNMLNILPVEIAIFNIVSDELPINKETKGITARNSVIKSEVPKDINPKITQEVKKEVKEVIPDKKQEKVIEEKIEDKKVIIQKDNSNIEEQFKKIKENWSEILIKVREFNHFLTAILTSAKLDIKEGEIVFSVNSTFHKKRLDNVETKKILQKIIQELTGENIDFQCIIQKVDLKNDSAMNNEKMVEDIFN